MVAALCWTLDALMDDRRRSRDICGWIAAALAIESVYPGCTDGHGHCGLRSGGVASPCSQTVIHLDDAAGPGRCNRIELGHRGRQSLPGGVAAGDVGGCRFLALRCRGQPAGAQWPGLAVRVPCYRPMFRAASGWLRGWGAPAPLCQAEEPAQGRLEARTGAHRPLRAFSPN